MSKLYLFVLVLGFTSNSLGQTTTKAGTPPATRAETHGKKLKTQAKPKTPEKDQIERYYDEDQHDYHEWNAREEVSYKRFLDEQKLEKKDMGAAKKEDQRAYWRWRHEHVDPK